MAVTGNGGARVSWAMFGLVGFALLFGVLANVETIIIKTHVQPVGIHECTYGPSYWCHNITNAAGCNAVKHCIQTTWETQNYPEDNDDVCTICKNMVKEARDTLESNATLDELKQVFYGSCQLLPLKVIKTECKKLADDFIPELVDTLASQMDPNVVCTVSGLCNNAHIDKLLLEQSKIDNEHHECEKCAIAMNKGENLVQNMSKDDILSRILMMCGELSSYSDACISIVRTYNNEIYNAVKSGFTKRNVCMLSGMCSEAFHPHADGYEKSKNALMGVEVSNAGERGRIQIQNSNEVSDELTCEFCEALVKHLRDILVSNTTEEQFLEVLNGLCKQTKTFSEECLAMVSKDYARIYQFLTSELQGKVLCSIVGICPNPRTFNDLNSNLPVFPLIPNYILQTSSAMNNEEVGSSRNKQDKQNPTLVVVDEQPPKVQDIKPIQKSPIIDIFYKDMHFVVNDVDMPTGKNTCFLCQSILNYIQQTVTDPKSEEKIRITMEESCLIIPKSFEEQCKQFIDQYADAFISLFAQEVDPSIICPKLQLCPTIDLSLISNKYNENKNNCPLCVIFMSALESEITNTDTEEMIKTKLEKLCTKMPTSWKAECTQFVSTQLENIMNMMVAQVKPEEICVLLDVCEPKTLSENVADDLETNMIASSDQVTVVFPGYNMGQLLANNYKMLEEPKVPTPFCLVCTVVMKYLNTEIKDKSNDEEIEHVLDTICSILPNVEENECQSFVNSNYEQILKAIKIGTEPTIACMALMVCDEVKIEKSQNNGLVKMKVNISTEPVDLDRSVECAACEAFATVFDDHINNNSLNIENIDMTELCDEVEIVHKDQCLEMIGSYAQSFKNLYNRVPNWMVCEEIALCDKNKSVAAYQLNNTNCLKGVEYWCASLDNAKECKVNSVFLNLVVFCCKTRYEHVHDDWIIKNLMEIMWKDCTTHCMKKQNVTKFHPKCTICKDVINDIKHKIENSQVEKDVKYRLEGLCDALPPSNKVKCVNFVEKYSDKILDEFIDDIKEESICAEIGYC